MRGLSIDQLRTLVEVVELGSFSAAARRLNLTQPAVSLQIRELENRCGLRLVERAGKAVVPTAAGQDLVAHAERIGAEADRALAAMRGYREGHVGRLHLGTGPTVLAFLLRPVLQGLRERHPNLELVITTGTTSDCRATPRERRRSRLHGVASRGPDLVATPVRTDEIIEDPAGDRERPAIGDHACRCRPADADQRISTRRPYAHEPRLDEGQQATEARPAMVFDTIGARIAAVAAGLGMGFIPRPEGEHGPPLAGTVLRPLDPPLTRTLGLVQRRNRQEDLPFRIVRDAILALANPVVVGREPAARPPRAP